MSEESNEGYVVCDCCFRTYKPTENDPFYPNERGSDIGSCSQCRTSNPCTRETQQLPMPRRLMDMTHITHVCNAGVACRYLLRDRGAFVCAQGSCLQARIDNAQNGKIGVSVGGKCSGHPDSRVSPPRIL